MQGVERVHYHPREGQTFEANLDVLIPALFKLRSCRDSLQTLVLADSLPDLILPALALTASRKTYIAPEVVKTLVRYCGPAFLERALGKHQARALQARYSDQREVLSGL
jgi:hypothetical protein